jgi:hypothetical protein
MTRPVDEVVLTLGEPYEQVRKQSHSTLPPVEPDTSWAGVLIRPAKFRFVDSRYGFVTPAAKFFMVQYDKNGNVGSLVLSPQVETLPLDESMAILTDLQTNSDGVGGNRFTLRPIVPSKTLRRRVVQFEHATHQRHDGRPTRNIRFRSISDAFGLTTDQTTSAT